MRANEKLCLGYELNPGDHPRRPYVCTQPRQTEESHRDGGWSPYFCRDCDERRIAQIDKALNAICDQMDAKLRGGGA